MELSWDASDCKSKQQGGNCEPETCHLSSTGRKYVLARDQSFVTLSGKDPAQMKVLMSLANRAMLVLFGVFFFGFSFMSLSSFFTHIETNQLLGGTKTGIPGEKPPDTPASRTWLVPHVTRAPCEDEPTAVR